MMRIFIKPVAARECKSVCVHVPSCVCLQRQRACCAQGTAAKRAEQLRRMVGEYGQCSELAHVRVPLPLDPTVMLTGIVPEECSVFKSALSPLRLTFRTAGRPTVAITACYALLRVVTPCWWLATS